MLIIRDGRFVAQYNLFTRLCREIETRQNGLPVVTKDNYELTAHANYETTSTAKVSTGSANDRETAGNAKESRHNYRF